MPPPHNMKKYTFLTKEQVRKLNELQDVIHGTGLHVIVTGECGCMKVYHPLLQDQIPLIFDRNGKEVKE